MDFLSFLSGQESHPLDRNPGFTFPWNERFLSQFCVAAGTAALGSAASDVLFFLERSGFRRNFYPEDRLGCIQGGSKLFIFSFNPFCGVSVPALLLALGFLSDISIRVSTGIRSSHVLCGNIPRFLPVPLVELLGIYPP